MPDCYPELNETQGLIRDTARRIVERELRTAQIGAANVERQGRTLTVKLANADKRTEAAEEPSFRVKVES